jgi:G3E family GTPase
MTRNEIIAAVKELGIKTERPAHQMKTEALQALLAPQTEVSKARGRKINPMSARQARLAVQATRALEGPIKKGRRPNATSARQQRLAAIEARKANGEVIKRGRPALAV